MHIIQLIDYIFLSGLGQRNAPLGIAGLLAGLASSAGSDRGVPVPSLRMSLTLAHQSKIRSMYCSRQSLASHENGSPASEIISTSNLTSTTRPDSSSDTSSVTDWESGLSTVRRQPTTAKPTPSSRKVEDISAFCESRLRAGTIAKAFELNTLGEARSRTRFAKVEEDSSPTKMKSTGSLDKLDRLSVRSELTKATVTSSAVPSGTPPSHGVQALRRRHRSVERQLDSVESEAGSSRERFSAAVFTHKPTKLAPKTPPSMRLTLKPNRMLLKSTIEALSAVPSDQEMDTSSTIYSLRSGEDMSSAAVQLSNAGSRSIQDHIIATQMNRLNREMPISDVYHERNMGLGLAPPLSELLVSSTNAPSIAVPVSSSTDDVFNSFDQISLADTVTEISDKTLKTTYTKRPPPGRPSKMHPSAWSTAAYRHRTPFDSATSDSEISLTLRHGTLMDMTRRDEADGRSMTDSNYSGYSPHRNLKLSTMLPSLSRHNLLDTEEKKTLGTPEKSNTVRAVAVIEADAKVTNSDAGSLC